MSQSGVYIAEVETSVVSLLSKGQSPEAVEALRRQVPIQREAFDSFVFQATQWARDDGAADSFSFACERLRAARQRDAAAIGQPVTLIPPSVSDHVDRIVSRWRRIPPIPGSLELPGEEAQLRDELYSSLGGDLGDGRAAAGWRVHSRMWSARISDGFVHPAVGAYLWHDNAGRYSQDRVVVGGPLIAALSAAGEMWGRWWREPQHRVAIEQEITAFASMLGWGP
ncbi:hypothetical protein [Williamsia sp. CHRR-6]|uniref:hypothetical protein n=1 Tax=Williamsia sp. CHRR-6 TaxID=2835871 RepID=UPI001BDB65AE|nr:hypothetical protein [Williamsia sp. CHRR-6]MBT0568170.1 hypothetical protein [Williamsia sp. CHRR-6]